MEARYLRLNFCLVALIILFGVGCSNNSIAPTSPAQLTAGSTIEGAADTSHVLWGIWSISYDADSGGIGTLPYRGITAHFDVTSLILPPACNDCITIKVNSYKPGMHLLDVDVTLRNPASIPGRDVRGILFTDSAGHELLNADGWTALYDIPGGDTINPFKAFAKAETKRVFQGLAEHTENFQIHIPLPPQFNAIKFAVDASWPGNCKEPYSIENFTQGKLFNTGVGNADITVDVLDWQDDVSKVTLVAPQINGASFTQFSHVSGSTWHLFIKNSEMAPAGDYDLRVIAASPNPGDVTMYNFIKLTISQWGEPSSPVDITPPSLNFQPLGIRTSGNYAYVAGGVNGLILFNIVSPSHPKWSSKWQTTDSALGIDLVSSRVYLACGTGGVDIFNISNPGSPVLVKNVPVSAYCYQIKVLGDYAYIACQAYGVAIVRVKPLDSAGVVNIVSTAGTAYDLAVDGSYAYIAESLTGVEIIDIDPPESASVIKTLPMAYEADAIVEAGGYAYVADYSAGVEVVDVDPPQSASIVNTISTPTPFTLFIDGNNLYVGDMHDFIIINISSPTTPIVVGHFPDGIEGWTRNVYAKGNYAYIGNMDVGLQSVDVSVPSTPKILDTLISPIAAEDCEISGNYAYISNWFGGVHVIDISDPTQAQDIHMTTLSMGNSPNLKILNGYAYISAGWGGFRIADLSIPDSPSVIKSVSTSGTAGKLDVDSGYAYIAALGKGIDIIDIDPPASASVVKTVTIPGNVLDVAVSNGYAYAATRTEGLQIVDVDPVGSASVVKVVPLADDGNAVVVDGDYAYVAANLQGLVIVDISSPENASIVNTVGVPAAMDLAVANGYAYIANNIVTFVDVNPVASAHVCGEIDTPFYFANSIAVNDRYAYVCSYSPPCGGVWIFKLW